MPSPNPLVLRFIEDAGNMTQSFGVGRVIGQIYAYLYFNPTPRNLADMQEALGISKGSASTGVRQLEQWGAVRKVWVKGDRKDYYEASDWFGKILRNAVVDTVGKKMTTYTSLIEEVESDLARIRDGDGEGAFIRERIARLRAFQQKAQGVWNKPMIRRLLR
jgi:DNA-binding transcriptional regulator GbsR (MarR family)